jgi:hypothetical protein
MDTKEAADKIGTTPRRLRQFLRSKKSTYVAVGSTSRYDFEETEIPELERRFKRWADGKVQPMPKHEAGAVKAASREERDKQVWAAETFAGSVPILADLRDPGVLARVRRIARAQEDRLNQLLLAKGLHISQGFTSSIHAVT